MTSKIYAELRILYRQGSTLPPFRCHLSFVQADLLRFLCCCEGLVFLCVVFSNHSQNDLSRWVSSFHIAFEVCHCSPVVKQMIIFLSVCPALEACISCCTTLDDIGRAEAQLLVFYFFFLSLTVFSGRCPKHRNMRRIEAQRKLPCEQKPVEDTLSK